MQASDNNLQAPLRPKSQAKFSGADLMDASGRFGNDTRHTRSASHVFYSNIMKTDIQAENATQSAQHSIFLWFQDWSLEYFYRRYHSRSQCVATKLFGMYIYWSLLTIITCLSTELIWAKRKHVEAFYMQSPVFLRLPVIFGFCLLLFFQRKYPVGVRNYIEEIMSVLFCMWGVSDIVYCVFADKIPVDASIQARMDAGSQSPHDLEYARPFRVGEGVYFLAYSGLFYVNLFNLSGLRFVRATLIAFSHIMMCLIVDQFYSDTQYTKMLIMITLSITVFSSLASRTWEAQSRQDYLMTLKLKIDRVWVSDLLRDMLPWRVIQQMKQTEQNRLLGISDDDGMGDMQRDMSEGMVVCDPNGNISVPVAQNYKCVTVLFCYISDFYHICTTTDPLTLVQLLNRVFSEFDMLTDKHGVYKVEAIAETYLLVAGCPTPDPMHAVSTVKAAQAMHLKVSEICREDIWDSQNLPAIKLAIGINSGPVAAGVVGIVTSKYQLFGDTVNTASRMCSSCAPGRIQLSESSYTELVKQGGHSGELEKRHNTIIIPRGKIAVKGKGMMNTFWAETASSFKSGTATASTNSTTLNFNGNDSTKNHQKQLPSISYSDILQTLNPEPPGSLTSQGFALKDSFFSKSTSHLPDVNGGGYVPPSHTPVKKKKRNSNIDLLHLAAVNENEEAEHDIEMKEIVDGRVASKSMSALKRPASKKRLSISGLPDVSEQFECDANDLEMLATFAQQSSTRSRTSSKSSNASRNGSLTIPASFGLKDRRLSRTRTGSITMVSSRTTSNSSVYSARSTKNDDITNMLMEEEHAGASTPLVNENILFGTSLSSSEYLQYNSYSLFFLDPALEVAFMKNMASSQRRNMITFSAIGLCVSTLLLATHRLRVDKLDNYYKDSILAISIMQFCLCLVALLMAISRKVSPFTREKQMSCIFYLYTVASVYNASDPEYYSQIHFMIFFICLFMLCMTLRFFTSFIFAILISLSYIAIIVTGYVHSVRQQRSLKELVFCIVLLIWSLISCSFPAYTFEKVARRDFLMNLMLIVESTTCRSLLYRMLPDPQLAESLLRGQEVVMLLHDVTFLYSDIKGYTELSAKLQPSELVVLLNQLYSSFEKHLDRRGVYKIDTIGDAFVVVGGMHLETGGGARVDGNVNIDPVHVLERVHNSLHQSLNENDGEEYPWNQMEEKCNAFVLQELGTSKRKLSNPDSNNEANHVNDILLFGADMFREIERMKRPESGCILTKPHLAHLGKDVTMRIGVHSGSGVGGVIGMKRPRFLIWGVDPMVANKLESAGSPGSIHISEISLARVTLNLKMLNLEVTGRSQTTPIPSDVVNADGTHATVPLTTFDISSTDAWQLDDNIESDAASSSALEFPMSPARTGSDMRNVAGSLISPHQKENYVIPHLTFPNNSVSFAGNLGGLRESF